MIARAVLLAAAMLVVASSGAGADDILVVAGDRVNVRFGPGTDQKVVGKVTSGQIVIGLERRGDWFRIELGGGRAGGWVHASLVRELPSSIAASPTGSEAFNRFRQTLDQESRRILDATGYYPFVGAEDLGGGTIEVTPSEDWFVGGGDLTDDAWRLYRLWKAENGDQAVTLAITDGRGNIYITVQDTATEPLLTVHH